MAPLWFTLLALLIVVYVILDGFDLGAGTIQGWVGRTPEERGQVVRAIGPVRDGNEVWLVAAGGTFFLAFPRAYAAAFSGFYLPLTIVLWLLLLRGVSLELRHHSSDRLWTLVWDRVFSFASTLLAFCLGAALANVVRGVPLSAERTFFTPLWASSRTGVFDPYTVAVGLFAVVVLAFHGSLWITLRAHDPVRARAIALARRFGKIVLIALPLLGAWTLWIQPHFRSRMSDAPWIGVFPLAALTAWILADRAVRRGAYGFAFLASGGGIAALMFTNVACLYPYLLPAREGSAFKGMTVHEAIAPSGLDTALYWWVPGIVLVSIYFYVLYRHVHGPIDLSDVSGH